MSRDNLKPSLYSYQRFKVRVDHITGWVLCSSADNSPVFLVCILKLKRLLSGRVHACTHFPQEMVRLRSFQWSNHAKVLHYVESFVIMDEGKDLLHRIIHYCLAQSLVSLCCHLLRPGRTTRLPPETCTSSSPFST